ncbi:hypothetical protein FRB98_008737 [Tulasnella sp. 332]|nr:hypothetical protein FRB98_008737 [Tulasnella sp. 332]
MTSTSKDPVSIISRHKVCCANEGSWKALESPFRLGPFDQAVNPIIPIQVVFVYKQAPSTHSVELVPVERLQCALTLLLDHYPHLTGRLHIDPSDGTPEITRLGSGAGLYVAKCSNRLDAYSSPGLTTPGRILMSNLPSAGNVLLAPFDMTLEGVCHDHILAIQHTRFSCGGVALGVRLLHKVTDADGFFQLMRDLAELYRGIPSSNIHGDLAPVVPSLTHPPHTRSYMSDVTGSNMTPEQRQAALDYKPSLLYVESNMGATEDSLLPSQKDSSALLEGSAANPPSSPTITSTPPITGRFLRFSGGELSALKAHATDPYSGSSSNSWVSTFEALSAHLHQSVYRARVQLRVNDPNQPKLSFPDFLTPVNLRSRLGLPPRYFANALLCVYTCLSHDVLANGPLWRVANALHDLTRTTYTTSKDEMNQTLKWIAVQPDKRRIKESFRLGTGSFMLSQWNKVDMYPGMAFEVPPSLVSPPFTPISLCDGLGYLLPTEAQGTTVDTGAIEVCLALSEPLWDVLDQDEEFRRFRDA